MSEHTPGPWFVRNDGDAVVWDGRGVTIAECSWIPGKWNRQLHANADLIADAPRFKAVIAELMSALKAIHDRLKPFVVTYQHQSEKDAERWAKEAIAKAEGKS